MHGRSFVRKRKPDKKIKERSKHHCVGHGSDRTNEENDQENEHHQENEHQDKDQVLAVSEKEKIRRAVKKGILQNLTTSMAKGEDTSDTSSDALKLKLTLDKDPDETDDFSGGITPYRAVVCKDIEKRENRKNQINNKNLQRRKIKSYDEGQSKPVSTNDPVAIGLQISEEREGK